jgi:hypothetical protein
VVQRAPGLAEIQFMPATLPDDPSGRLPKVSRDLPTQDGQGAPGLPGPLLIYSGSLRQPTLVALLLRGVLRPPLRLRQSVTH